MELFPRIFALVSTLLITCTVNQSYALDPARPPPLARILVLDNVVTLLLRYTGPTSFFIHPFAEIVGQTPVSQLVEQLGESIANQWTLSIDRFVAAERITSLSDWRGAMQGMTVSTALLPVSDNLNTLFDLQVDFDLGYASPSRIMLILSAFLERANVPVVQGLNRRDADRDTEMLLDKRQVAEAVLRTLPADICPAQAPYDDAEFWSYVSGDPLRPQNPITRAACTATTPIPSEPVRTCYGVSSKKWMGYEALRDNIEAFCHLAGEQGVHDKDSGSIMRPYNVGGDYVGLNIDWPAGSTWKADAPSCFSYMRDIMNTCDVPNQASNPYNWKAGGVIEVGEVKYRITPLTDRYLPGYCRARVLERADWRGNDVKGSQRDWTFRLIVDVYDQAGDRVGGTDGSGVEAGKDGANGYVFNGLYQPLIITPQGSGDMPLQFKIGDNAWANTDGRKFTLEGGPPTRFPGQHCEETAWDGDFHHEPGQAARSVTCWFPC